MALSAAARAALEQFKTQQAAGPIETEESEADGATGGAGENAVLPSRPDGPGGLNGLRRPPAQNQGADLNATTAVRLERLTAGTTGLFRPEQPKTLKDSGVSYRVVESLLLKTIKQEGALNEGQLSDHLKLGINVFKAILTSLHKRELLDTPQPQHYDLTNRGRELTSLLEREDAYVGPAPVSFAAYCAMCQQQAKRERRASMSDVNEVFANYPMREELKLMLKEGFNSQRVMLFYGPPGNGKSLITDNLHRLLRDPVVLPYAFEFNLAWCSFTIPPITSCVMT